MPSERDLQFDVLLESIGAFVEAKRELDQAHSNYDGQSWGYAGRRYIDDVDQTRKDAMTALRRVIRTMVSEVIEDKAKEK